MTAVQQHALLPLPAVTQLLLKGSAAFCSAFRRLQHLRSGLQLHLRSRLPCAAATNTSETLAGWQHVGCRVPTYSQELAESQGRGHLFHAHLPYVPGITPPRMRLHCITNNPPAKLVQGSHKHCSHKGIHELPAHFLLPTARGLSRYNLMRRAGPLQYCLDVQEMYDLTSACLAGRRMWDALPAHIRERVYFFNSFFWTKLSEKAPQGTQTSAEKADQAFERVKRWTKVLGLAGGLHVGCCVWGPSAGLARLKLCIQGLQHLMLLSTDGCTDAPINLPHVAGVAACWLVSPELCTVAETCICVCV